MQHRELGRRLIPPIITSTRAVALTSLGWRCLHRDAWSEKHHVFFGETTAFFQSTISKLGPYSRKPGGGFEASDASEQWIIEDDSNSPIGRAILQVLRGDFPQGILLLDLETRPDPALEDILAQLMTQSLLVRELVTLKVIPVNGASNTMLQSICGDFKTRVATFSAQHLPETHKQTVYEVEYQKWFESDAGKKAMTSLSWLKKRLDRINSTKKSSKNAERRSWLFSFLTLGRGRRQHEKMIHPLKKMRP